jgi:hypothetical protein
VPGQTTATIAPPSDEHLFAFRPRKGWPKRRQWLQRVAVAAQLTTGCRAWLALVAGRSDDLGKPVWGTQERMGAQMGMSARSCRRYVREAELAGFVKVQRSHPYRGRSGRWERRASNVYVLTVPPGGADGSPEAPVRVRKAGYCVLKCRSHLGATDGPSTPPTGVENLSATPEADSCDRETGEIHPSMPPEVFARHLDEARAALRRARPGG